MVDLHQHSKFSDGSDSIKQLVAANKSKGVKVFSLTDHDTIDGTKYILKNCIKQNGNIKYFTGIEFSTQDNGKTVHIVAYDYDVKNKTINKLLKKVKKLRKLRIKRYIALLKDEFGIKLDKESLVKIKAQDNPNRPFVAQILIQKGYGSTIKEVIAKYLHKEYIDLMLSTELVVSTLGKQNVICVLAHPLGGIGEKRVEPDVLEERLARFVSCGLKGIEAFYSLYNKQESDFLLSLANKHNLLVSGGSDYHGTIKTVQIGELSCDGFTPADEDFTILNAIKNFYYL